MGETISVITCISLVISAIFAILNYMQGSSGEIHYSLTLICESPYIKLTEIN